MDLTALSKERIQEIGRSYSNLKLSGEVGTQTATIVEFAVVLAIIYMVFEGLFKNILVFPFDLIAYVGFVITLGGYGGVDAFFVNVPKLTAVITRNWSGELHPYGTGFAPKTFRQTYDPNEDFISTRTDNLTLEVETLFRTSNGIPVRYKLNMAIGPQLNLLGLYIRTDLSTIVNGLLDYVRRTLTSIITEKTDVDLLAPDMTNALCEALITKLEDEKDTLGNTLEERFGVKFEFPSIGAPEFEKDYDQGKLAHVLREMIIVDIKALMEIGLTADQAKQATLILNKEDVSEVSHVHRLDVSPIVADLARDLGVGVGRFAQGLRIVAGKDVPTPPPPEQPAQ